MNDSMQKELAWGTAKHKRMVDAVLARKRMSQNRLASVRTKWNNAEDKFKLASNLETKNDGIRRNLRDQGKPQFTTIEIPYSYAILLSSHTYISSVFLSRNPVHQFIARHGAPEQATLGLEALIDYQIQVGGALVPYYIWLHDMLKYGIGIISEYWDEEYVTSSQIVEKPVTFLGLPVPGTAPKKVRETTKQKSFFGNKVFNVRPQDWFPDPRVTMANFQNGEFCGRYVEVGWNTLLKGRSRGQYYNLEALAQRARLRTMNRDSGGRSADLPDPNNQDLIQYSIDDADKGFFTLIEMEIEIVPFDWELGSSKDPEKWIFTVGNEEVLIECRPCNYNHGKFNFSVMEYEIEGYNLSKRGQMEILEPLNNTMEWLFNTHFFNVRKALNDQYVVDPSRVIMKDMSDPNAGKLVRLRPEFYGTDVRTAVHQLSTVDMTRTHVQDTLVIGELMQRATGAMDSVMGMLQPGGRKTATEVRTSSTFGINRLKTLAEFGSAMGFAPHAQKLVQNTQQMYDDELLFRIAGDLAPGMQPYMRVNPELIRGFYDFVPVDGTMPVDRYAMATMWKDMLVNLRNVPQVGQSYDIAGIFSWIARLSGLRNIERFRVNVMPDQQFNQNVQAGNTTLMGGSNGTIASGTGNSPDGTPRVGRSGTVQGVGPVG